MGLAPVRECEPLATGEATKNRLLLGPRQALEFDFEGGLGFVDGGEQFMGLRQPPAMRGGEPERGPAPGEVQGKSRHLPFHGDLRVIAGTFDRLIAK